ncbi:MAG: hypothetical protein L6R39_003517 [Caloplaca ligustica]|nr:MAG: hypothetical protein L6R39_003517 [Caloplaca ligustica]
MAENSQLVDSSGQQPVDPVAQESDSVTRLSFDIENQSSTDSYSSSEPSEQETGVRQALRKRLAGIKKALHISESPYNHQLDQTIRPLDSYQKGYGTLAAIVDADPSWLIYRKFGWLRNRLLLDLQDELVTYERELELIDGNISRLGDLDKVLASRRNDERKKTRRRGLLKEIRQKFVEYDEQLLHLQQIQAIKPPTVRNQNTLYRLIRKNECLVNEETEWIYRGEDLAALAHGPEYGWFNGFLEDTMNAISRSMTTFLFRDRHLKKKTGNVDVALLSPRRLEIFVRTVFTILTAVLFLLPVLALLRLQPTHADEARHAAYLQLAVVFVFTLLFSASCSIFTKAKRQEVFTATGAYCAVLVVFLGNTQNTITNDANWNLKS